MIIALVAVVSDWVPPPCRDHKPGGAARCAERDLAKAETELNLEFNRAVGRLRNCRPRNTVKCYYWGKALPRLQREQVAWKVWRDAKSDLDAVGMEGTSGEAEVRDTFKTTMTKARSAELSKVGRD